MKRLLLYMFFHICFCGKYGFVISQPNYYQIDKLLPNSFISHIVINCFYKDRFGYMWIGTSNGLIKYDGNNTTVYRKRANDSNSIVSNNITQIFENKEGFLFVFGSETEYSRYNYDLDNFERIKANDSEQSYQLPIPANKRTAKYLCTNENIYSYNNRTGKYEKVPLRHNTSQLNINSYIEDKNGKLWIGSYKRGFLKYNPLDSSLIPFYPNSSNKSSQLNSRISCLYYDNNQMIWIGGRREKIDLFDPLKEVFIKSWNNSNNDQKINLSIYSICEDEKGQIWMASENGINIYNKKKDRFTIIKNNSYNNSTLSANTVRVLYKDISKIIWIGTLGGVNVFDQNRTKFISNLNSINYSGNELNRSFKSVFKDRDGELWIGTDFGLNKLNKDGKILKTYVSDKNNKSTITFGGVCAIHQDKLGQFWIGTWGGGLSKFNKQNGTFIRYNFIENNRNNPKTLGDVNIQCIKEDADGLIWIGTVMGVVDVLNPQKGTFEHILLNGQEIRSLLIDNENNAVWCCSSNGLFKINKTNKNVTQYINNELDTNSISDNITNDIIKDKNGQIWVTTLNGLNKFNTQTGKFTVYTSLNYIDLTNLFGLQIDEQGFLWFSNSQYLLKLDPVSKKIWYYNESDGLVMNIRYSNKLSTGELVFGGLDGINIFNPITIQSNEKAPSLVITDLKIYNKSVKWQENNILTKVVNRTKDIKFSYNIKQFSFDYNALSYSAQNKFKYLYKLEGIDKEWYFNDNNRSVNYSNIPSGKYTFKVKVSTREGVWTNDETSINLNIVPPFWKTLGFNIFIILLIIGLIFLWIKIQTYKIKRRNEHLEHIVKIRSEHLIKANTELEVQKKEVERMATIVHDTDQKRIRYLINISHDFRTPLTLIINPIEKILSKITGNQEISVLLQLISKNAKSLLNLINQVFDMHKLETNNMLLQVSEHKLISFLSSIYESFRYTANNQNIKFSFEKNFTTETGWFDEQKLERVLINLLSNAFKFTPQNGAIVLKAELSDNKDTIKIWVIDNGIGIPDDKLELIFDRFYQVSNEMTNAAYGTGIGLNLVKELIEIHHGSINVTSKLGKGSCFCIEYPIQRNSYNESEIYILNNSQQSQTETILINNETQILPNAQAPQNAPLILLVEDNIDLRVFVKQNMAVYYHIIEAENGLVGYEQVCECLPDIVISDILMPHMNGFELCEKIKTNDTICHIPVILLTSQLDVENQLHGLSIKADDYITKPFIIEVLKKRIDAILDNRKLMRKRFAQEFKIGPTEKPIIHLDQLFIEKAIRIVETNMSNTTFDLNAFSKEMNLSSRQLLNKMKALTDFSPVDFIRYIRLKKAAQLISQSGLNVSEIAFQTGFSNALYFSTAFKKQFGVSPTSYKP